MVIWLLWFKKKRLTKKWWSSYLDKTLPSPSKLYWHDCLIDLFHLLFVFISQHDFLYFHLFPTLYHFFHFTRFSNQARIDKKISSFDPFVYLLRLNLLILFFLIRLLDLILLFHSLLLFLLLSSRLFLFLFRFTLLFLFFFVLLFLFLFVLLFLFLFVLLFLSLFLFLFHLCFVLFFLFFCILLLPFLALILLWISFTQFLLFFLFFLFFNFLFLNFLLFLSFNFLKFLLLFPFLCHQVKLQLQLFFFDKLVNNFAYFEALLRFFFELLFEFQKIDFGITIWSADNHELFLYNKRDQYTLICYLPTGLGYS